MFLWMLRVGCMLALDKPYVTSSEECGIETSEKFCLEYGSATQLYLVPYIQHEEQVIFGFLGDMSYCNCHLEEILNNSVD